MLHRREFVLGALGAALVGAEGLSGCGSGNSSVANTQLRVVDAIVGTPSVDVLLDNVTVQRGLAYGTAVQAPAITSGAHALRLNASGTNNSLIAADMVFNASTSYTLVAAGSNASPTFLVLTNNITPPSQGNVRINVVDASPIASALDVYVTASTTDISSGSVNPVLSGVNSSNVLPLPGELPAGNYRVRVTLAGAKMAIADSGASGTALTAGKAYTVVLFGDNTTAFRLSVLFLADN